MPCSFIAPHVNVSSKGMVVRLSIRIRNLLCRIVMRLDERLGVPSPGLLNETERFHAVKRVLRQDVPIITLERVVTNGNCITYRLRNTLRVEWAVQICEALFGKGGKYEADNQPNA